MSNKFGDEDLLSVADGLRRLIDTEDDVHKFKELARRYVPILEERARATPRVALIVRDGVPQLQVVVAVGPVEVMTVDFQSLGKNGVNADELEKVLTWTRMLPDQKAVGDLQDRVVHVFQKLGLVLN